MITQRTALRLEQWAIEGSLVLFAVILVAGIGTGVLFAISVLAYHRRRTAQFKLIAVALGALFLRSFVGIGTVLGLVPMWLHHFIEHSLDFLIAAAVLYAVYAYAPGSLDTID